MRTPTITRHAAERCAEMGISTKVAKHIVMNPSVTYAGRPGDQRESRVYLSDEHPEYAVVAGPDRFEPDLLRVVTVLFRESEDYVRNGATCIPGSRSTPKDP